MLLLDILTVLEGLEGLMLIFFLLGIVLIVIEMIMPGFGIAGTIGIISLIIATVIAYQVVSPKIFMLIIALVLIGIATALILIYRSAIKGGRVSKLFILKTKNSGKEGYSSTPVNTDLVGREGVAITSLRPTGTGKFDGQKIDVVSDGSYIQQGKKIKIVEVEGYRNIVREID